MNKAAIILAAGKGARMNSDLPKVAHRAAGKPLVEWVVRAVSGADIDRIVLVIGHGKDTVKGLFEGSGYPIQYAEQNEQLGTAHAAQMAETTLAGFDGDVFVLVGDGPLIRPEVLKAIHERHVESGAAATLATAVLDDPTGYGRVVRDADGKFKGIVEQKDATPEQLEIREINPSLYCFRAEALWDALRRIDPSPVTGEYYITDVPALLMAQGDLVEVIPAAGPEEAMSVNTPEQLREVEAVLKTRGERDPAPEGAARGEGG
jgi:bifunctional UDP-N-acetylglucosamine pyrophosphorylase/glucosamine-1-phosphate N-acetyltransferase